MPNRSAPFFASLLLPALLACGGSTPPAEAPPSGDAAGAQTENVAWADMNREQRLKYMQTTVLPTMKGHFAKWEPHEFDAMNCASCHGDGAKDGSFKMPNPKLPKLPSDEAGFKKMTEEHPEAAKFMMTVVEPEMARLLGVPPYDPTTHKGFGCGGCHPH